MSPAGQDVVVERHASGWRVRLSLRAEHVWAEKRTFVVEEVEVRREYSEDVQPITERVRREELTFR